MTEPQRSRVIPLAEALRALPGPAGEHSASLLRRGTLDARLAAAPSRPAPPGSHEQDEVYVVVRGGGVLLHDGRRDRFEAGDLLFVAAGTEHGFEEVTPDLVVWVVFYGPHGGEAAGRHPDRRG
jgi:mannose-6-phosphate isomerase-like protein (cupin superfamily)